MTLPERGRDPNSAWRDFPPRPPPFKVELGVGKTEVGCADQAGRAVAGMINFTDAGRHFHAYVILGRSASRQTRRDALRVLDSLRFDPAVSPSWRAGP